MRHLIIETKEGEKIDTSDILKLLSFIPSPPIRSSNFQKIEGRPGALLISNDLDSRPINVKMSFLARDTGDFILKRDKVFALFDSEDFYYLIDSWQPFKRWKVVCEDFNPEYHALRLGIINLTFTAFDGVSESNASTQTPFTFEADAWGIGENMIGEDLKYTFHEQNFRVYNAGDFEVDPRTKPFLITFNGASRNLRIANLTTGDIWSYTGDTRPTDTIKIDRIYSYKNDTSIFRDTNHKLITLAEGWNDFVVSGTLAFFEIKFDFRFYYK